MLQLTWAIRLAGWTCLIAGCATGPETGGDPGAGDDTRSPPSAQRCGADGSKDPSESDIDIVDLSAGGEHACAVDDTCRVYCWGRNDDGQLGDGTTLDRTRPMRVPALEDVQKVAAGAAHTCALHHDGRVSCWGFGREDGRPHRVTGISTDTKLVGYSDSGRHPDTGWGHSCNLDEHLDGIVDIAAGLTETCAIHESGGVLCWDRRIRSSRSEKTAAGCPSPIWGIEDAVDIGVGTRSTCALHADGTATCWGEDVTTPEHRDIEIPGKTAVPRATQPMVHFEKPGGWEKLAVGGWESCMQTARGTVHCLGSNIDGSLEPDAPHPLYGPTRLDWLQGALAVAADGQQICAAGADGTGDDRVRCAGLDEGALVEGERADASDPRAVAGNDGAVAIALGGYTLAGSQLKPSHPRVPGGGLLEAARRGVSAIDIEREGGTVSGYVMGNSGGFGCVRTDENDVACWGNNDHGQLGDGTTDSRATARRVDFSRRTTPKATSEAEGEQSREEEASETNETSDENCATERVYGPSEAVHTAVFRYRGRSRTFHLPRLGAELIERPDGTELLRIAFPDVTVGALEGTPDSETYPWNERRWANYSVFVELPDEIDAGEESEEHELPVTVGPEEKLPKKWDCMRVSPGGRGSAVLRQWERPDPGTTSGHAAGRVEIGTGPAAFGELAVDFDIDGVVPPPGERAVPANDSFFRAAQRESERKERRGANEDTADAARRPVQKVAVVSDSDSNRLSVTLRGEDESRRFVSESFAGRPGAYRGEFEATDEANLVVDVKRFGSDGAEGRILRLDGPPNALHFFEHLDARSELPDDRNGEVVATFDVDSIVRLPAIDPIYISSELEPPGLLSYGALRPKGLPDIGSSVEFRTGPIGLDDHRKRSRFLFQPTTSGQKRVGVEHRTGIVKDGELRRKTDSALDRFVLSGKTGLAVTSVHSFQMRYALAANRKDGLEALELESAETQKTRGRIRYRVPTRLTAGYRDHDIVFEASNPFQGRHRWSYPTRRQAVPEAQIPLMMTALDMEPGDATTFTSVTATAERSGRRGPAGGLDSAPSVRTYRIEPTFETVRVGVVDTRNVRVGDGQETARVVRVAHLGDWGPQIALYWIGTDSGRLLKYRRRDEDEFFYRVDE